jgi:hypothetical protein
MQNGEIIEQPVNLETLTPRYTSQVLAMLDYVAGNKPSPIDPVQPAPVAGQPFFMCVTRGSASSGWVGGERGDAGWVLGVVGMGGQGRGVEGETGGWGGGGRRRGWRPNVPLFLKGLTLVCRRKDGAQGARVQPFPWTT